MPTIFRYRGYRFFFVSYDCTEPRHVHVTKENKECKFWVRSSTNVILADNYGFSQRELNVIKKTTMDKFEIIKTVWDEHCN